MTSLGAREKLIALLRKAAAGLIVTNDDLLQAVPDPASLGQFERSAWQRLSQWADDDDIRARDSDYADMQRNQIRDALCDLEALENGYDECEVEWGDHQATRIPFWGCLVTLCLVTIIFYLMLQNGFFMHGD